MNRMNRTGRYFNIAQTQRIDFPHQFVEQVIAIAQAVMG